VGIRGDEQAISPFSSSVSSCIVFLSVVRREGAGQYTGASIPDAGTTFTLTGVKLYANPTTAQNALGLKTPSAKY
jgi:hypothetical protein